MNRWFDPAESDPATWRGTAGEGERRGESVNGVVERAAATATPYRREWDTVLHGPAVSEEFRTREYAHARVLYDGGVETNGRVKLLAAGHLWGDGEDHQRFRAQYRRAPDLQTVPFEEYTVWTEYRFGTVRRTDDGVVFEADADRTDDDLRTLPWRDLYSPVQDRVAELELVRNPALARYRLRERDEWADVAARLRFDPAAFDVGP